MNKIILAMLAASKEEGSFISPEEILFTRGKMVNEMPLVIADAIIAGVNIGLYYAYMFTLPEKQFIADQKEKFDTMLNNEVVKWLKVGTDSRKLLGEGNE